MRTLSSFLALALAACSSASVAPNDGGGDTTPTDATSDGTSDVASDVIGPDTSPSGCPASQPTNGSTCSPVGLACSYGTDPRAACRTLATCGATGWSVPTNTCAAETCPSSTPMNQSSCTDMGAICAFSDGTRCDCEPCPPGGPACMPGPLRWFCSPPPADPNCPAAMPNIGTACSPNNTTCNYGGCSGGWNLQCQNGAWVNQPTPCPG